MTESHHAALLEAFPGEEHRFFMPMIIGEDAEDADHGAAAILAGKKTATSAAFWDFPDGRVPFAGALSVLVDGSGNPRAILETQRVDIIPFSCADEALAAAYGEWDLTLATWRTKMRAWYETSARRHDQTFSDNTPIICEWFKVVKTLPS